VADGQALADDLDHHADDPALGDQIGVGALAEHVRRFSRFRRAVTRRDAQAPLSAQVLERRLADQAQGQPQAQAESDIDGLGGTPVTEMVDLVSRHRPAS
jgi:hypothetical protein